ncbi:hypothetical protein Q427_10480 [Halomonas sp. BC04]|nr:hypothetical protein Q427_10480 [Halomonas sp. BC04]
MVSPTEEEATADTMLVLHESQLVPVLQLLEGCQENA